MFTGERVLSEKMYDGMSVGTLQPLQEVLDVIRELEHGRIAARWSKVSTRIEKPHTQRTHSAALSRAVGGSEMLLSGEWKEKCIKNVKCIHLGRSQARACIAKGKHNRENM